MHASDPAAYGGPRLARTVLDLAAADADAGVDLAVRTRGFSRVAADSRLHDRLIAAHLADRPPAGSAAPADGLAGQEWWEKASALVPRLVASRPAPEPARLVELALGSCPPELAARLVTDVRTALGVPPPATLVEEVLPARAEQVDGLAEPLASWLRVWDWSPVLPAAVLADWAPMLDAVRRLRPAGPSDPRTAPVPEAVKAIPALDVEDLLQVAAEHGPQAAASALAAAEDAGDDGYAMVLHHLVAADPAAWTADVAAILATLKRPELGAFYLAAAAVLADHPGAFPGGIPAGAVTAALDLRRVLAGPAPAATKGTDGGPSTGAFFADQALFDLLTTIWRTGTDLDDGQEKAVLAHPHTLAAPLTHSAEDTVPTEDVEVE